MRLSVYPRAQTLPRFLVPPSKYTSRVNEIVVQKQQLRQQVRARRAARTEAARQADEVALAEQLLTLVRDRNAQTISCFVSTPFEPGTARFLQHPALSSITTLLPRSRTDGTLEWVQHDGADFAPGLFGIYEPTGEVASQTTVENVELMFVPAAAADLHANRLGWGRGYFDRFLSGLSHRPSVFAVVFDNEIFDVLPTEPHDVKMSGVVTPQRTIVFEPRT